jgi:hypothetical protein
MIFMMPQKPPDFSSMKPNTFYGIGLYYGLVSLILSLFPLALGIATLLHSEVWWQTTIGGLFTLIGSTGIYYSIDILYSCIRHFLRLYLK